MIRALIALLAVVGCGDGPADAPVCTVNLAEAEVRRCDGEWVQLRDLACGHPVTLIDIGVGVDKHCVEATALYATDPKWDELQARGLEIVQVFLTDEDNDVPTTGWCVEYSEHHEIDFTFAMDPYGNTVEAGIIDLPPVNLVLDASGETVYEWYGIMPADKRQQIEALLPPPP